MWNFFRGSIISEIDSDDEPEIVRFSYDGKHVIIGCKNNRVRIWDWRKRWVRIWNRQKLKEVILPEMQTVEIACDREIIYTYNRDLHVCKINLRTLQVSVHQELPILAAPVLSPDGNDVLFGQPGESGFFCWNNLTRHNVRHNAGGYTWILYFIH